MRRLLLLCLLTLASALISKAQPFHFHTDPYSTVLNSPVLANTALSSTYYDTVQTVLYDQWTNYIAYKNGTSFPGGYEFKSIEDIVRLGVRHNTKVAAAYDYKVTFEVRKYAHISPTTPASVDTFQLSISYDPDSLQPYHDLSVYKFNGYMKFQVVVTGIYDVSGGTPVSVSRSALAKNFYIETEIAAQRDIQLLPDIVTDCGNSVSGSLLHVEWETLKPGTSVGYCLKRDGNFSDFMEYKPLEFELEWTYIDDYACDFSTTPPTYSYKFPLSGEVPYNFIRNSTKIRTSQKSYDIPLIYEHGAIVYRIRALQPDRDSMYKVLRYSGWTLADTGTLAMDYCFPAHGFLITLPHTSDSLNWQYTINFAEEGKYKHVINYFDGALKERQT